MKFLIFLLLLSACGGGPDCKNHIHTVTIIPFPEKATCPPGEYALSAKQLFWDNGQVKGIELVCGKAACI